MSTRQAAYSSTVVPALVSLLMFLPSISATEAEVSVPELEWEQTFGGSSLDAGYSVQQTTDGGYIIAGETCSYGAGNYDVYLIKTDGSGSTQWEQTFGGSGSDTGFSVQQTTDGGYIIAGHTYSYSAGNYDVYLVKLMGIAQDIIALVDTVEEMNLQQGIENSLDAKLEAVLASLEAANAGDRNDAINKLQAFINAVEAQRRSKLNDEQADQLVDDASHIISLLGGGTGAPPLTSAITAQRGLAQNYPNPFNPDTWIPYQLADDVSVIIRIYSVSGKVVRTLNLGHKPAGTYISKGKAAYWDGRSEAGEQVASGVYFYTIQAGEFTATKKMVVAK